MKKFLSVLLSLCMLVSAVPAFAGEYTADDDTVFYISFDEELPEGSTGYNLSVLDEGVYGKCAWFNGSTSYIHLPDNITKGVSDFTMAAWVKVTGTTKGWQRVFDLGNGTESYAFLGIPYTTTDIRGAVKVSGGNEQRATAEGVVSKNKWMHIAFVQEGNVGTVYVDGKAMATTDLSSTLDAMGNTATNYIGRSQFSGDPYLNAYLDELVFAKRAFSEDEIATMATFPEPVITEETILDAIDIPVKDSVKENVTLQTEALGYPVTWASSNEEIVYPYDIENGDYVIPKGKVTRGDEDTVVTLTASVDYNGTILTKDIDCNIIAKPQPVGETEAYLYVYFRGNVNGSPERLSIHLAGSEDSYEWFDLNGNWPILESTMGTQCLRDPYLLRSKDGDRFYLIATDLNTQDGQGWGPWSLEGSKYLMIWESDDLVNWSEQRMVKFANDDIGCAWAPEATWDPDTEEYLVYASGKDLTLGSSAIDTVYVVRTRDFRTFTEPEYFVRPFEDNGVTTYGEGTRRIAAIDSNIIQANDGKFYHFYKKYNSVVQMLVSDHASGPWEEVPGYTPIGGEGPGSFLVKGTENQYCLMIDNYSVYVPYLTDDIASGIFRAGSGTVKMPTGSKHGGFLPINAEEYARVMEKWGNPQVDEEGTAAKYSYDFEEDASAYLKGNAKIEYSEERESNVLVLDGENSYFEFPEGIFDRQSTFTLSFDVKNDNSPQSNMTFSLGTGEEQYAFFKINDTTMRSALTISGWSYEEKAISNDLGSLTDTWMHIDLVVTPDSITIYKDGAQVAKNDAMTKTVYHLAEDGLSAYLGKSMFSADPYFKGEFDNVKLYYRALTNGEIAEGAGYASDELAQLDAESISFGCDVNYVTGNITLPSVGTYGSHITWASSDESIIALDGTVNVPEEGVKKVTLTGTFVYGDTEYVKEYVLLVKPVTSYLTSTLESKWKTYNIPVATKTVTYKFDLTAAQEKIDAGVSFGDKDVTPTAYGHMPIYVRVTKDGVFDAYNANSYQKTETVSYEADKTYPFTIEVDIANKKYSVFVEVDGVTKTIANNFTMRTSATCDDLGKIMVYAGNGVTTEGLLKVTDLEVILPSAIRFENVILSEGKVTGNVISEEALGESVVIVASYDADGTLMSAKAVQIVNTAFEADVTTENVKVMLWNSVSGMIPYIDSITVE
ncbi:MAG: LamG-like jellyroll fold domain-containing protein [Clostridia bacterium]